LSLLKPGINDVVAYLTWMSVSISSQI